MNMMTDGEMILVNDFLANKTGTAFLETENALSLGESLSWLRRQQQYCCNQSKTQARMLPLKNPRMAGENEWANRR